MAEEREYVLDRPNRRKSSSKTTKAIVTLLLLVTAALIAVITIGGWSELEGMQVVQIGYIVLYVLMAFYVSRWNRGVLPLAAALSILLGIFAAVGGPAWFDRDTTGFARPHSIFGGTGLAADFLGLLVLLLIPIQVLLIAFAMQGFRQNWHVEVEVPADEIPGRRSAAPAAA